MKKFIVYVGLNDKVSKAQEINTLDAFKIATNIAIETVGFSTISEAKGVYTHDDGSIVTETTLRCEFCDVSLEAVKKFALACKTAFNQESIGFEEVKSDFEFI